ncbi:MAG TPA: metalloregulator ArsR/SmtB family transcription factor [Verrucomicrobiae bacterium]|nr:metalloregulator ArsR/SmtB family transcription factor [Verrucomicrobiae bacterium]
MNSHPLHGVAGDEKDVGIRYKMRSGEPMAKRCLVDGDEQVFELQVRICKAFANSTRLRMLDLLAKGEYTVSDIQAALGITLPNVSQHLAILRGAGVVTTRREGKQIYCSLTMKEVKEACQLIRDVLRAQLRNGRKLVV